MHNSPIVVKMLGGLKQFKYVIFCILGTVQNFLLGGGWSFLGKVPIGVAVKNGHPLPQGAGSFSGQQGRIARKGHQGLRENCAKGIFCLVLFLFLCV